jgi:hypothetical protein
MSSANAQPSGLTSATPNPGFTIAAIAGVLAAASVSWLAAMIAWTLAGQPIIGMFSDSVWYLAIADYYRSLAGGDLPVYAQAAYDTSRFPPVYSLLIAVVGGGMQHQEVVNHLSIALSFAAGLAVFAWLRSSGASPLAALAAFPAVYVTPALLDWLLIPLSEPLFLIGLLLSLVAAQRARAGSIDVLIAAAVVSLLPLIRSAGIVLVAAYALWILWVPCASAKRRLLSIVVAAAPATLWALYRSTKPVFLDYASEMSLARMIEEGGTLAGFALAQVTSLLHAVQSWFGVAGCSPASAGIAILGAAACHGGWLRLRNRELDAIFVPLYVGMLLLWPYPLEMPRLLGVVMPIVSTWTLLGVSSWIGRSATAPTVRAAVFVGLASALLALPTWTAMAQRAALSADATLEPYKRTPAYFSAGDETIALAGLETSARILAVIEDAAAIVPKGECVFSTQTALVMAASRGQLRSRPTPRIDPGRPLAQQLAECRYLIVMQLGSRQAHATPLYPLDEVQAEMEPVLVSRSSHGATASIAAALLVRNDD